MASGSDQNVLDSDTEAPAEEKVLLNLQVDVKETSACERHVVVTVPREDIDRYHDEVLATLEPKAEVPGFRPGKAPRKLIQTRFKEHVEEQVKGKLLMDSMTQISESQQFTAISEPDIDLDSVKLPDDGSLTFEFNIEVRPEFDLPEWKGLKLERPSHTFGDEEVSEHLTRLLDRYAHTVTVDEEAAPEMLITADMTVKNGDEIVGHFPEESLRVRPILTFADARLEGFDKLVKGKKAGDTVTGKLKISRDAELEELRGKEVDVELTIKAVQKRESPELTKSFLDRIGGFQDESELRLAVREELEKQLNYRQQQKIRQQITALLLGTAKWELPKAMLRRQAGRELQRYILELRSAGFPEEQINKHANEVQGNVLQSTERSLKEHFILEKIAENEKIDAEPSDYQREIDMIAAQSDESPRRVRTRLEKRGMMDTLRNQIVERKVIDLICMHADFTDIGYEAPKYDTAAVSHAVAVKREEQIPEAKNSPGEEPLRPTKEKE